MCLAVPGKLLSIDHTSEPRMAVADFAGIRKDVCLEWLPEAEIGNYVIVHVGFALSVLDEAEALETLELLRQMGEGLAEDAAQ
jgi:hydrogenase expression/formation protein HypC